MFDVTESKYILFQYIQILKVEEVSFFKHLMYFKLR